MNALARALAFAIAGGWFLASEVQARAQNSAVVPGANNVIVQQSAGASVRIDNSHVLNEFTVNYSQTTSSTIVKSTVIHSTLDLTKLTQLLSTKLAPLATTADVARLTEAVERFSDSLQLLEDLRAMTASNLASDGRIERVLLNIDERLANGDADAVDARRAELASAKTFLKRSTQRWWFELSFRGDDEPFQNTHRVGAGPAASLTYDFARLGVDASLFLGGRVAYSWGGVKVTFVDPAGQVVSSDRDTDRRIPLLGVLGVRLLPTNDFVLVMGLSGGAELYTTDGPGGDGSTWRAAVEPGAMVWLSDSALISFGLSFGARGAEASEQRYSGFGATLESRRTNPQATAEANVGIVFAP